MVHPPTSPADLVIDVVASAALPSPPSFTLTGFNGANISNWNDLITALALLQGSLWSRGREGGEKEELIVAEENGPPAGGRLAAAAPH